MKWTPRLLSKKFGKGGMPRGGGPHTDKKRTAWNLSKFRFFLWFVVPAIGLILITQFTSQTEDAHEAESLHQAALAEFRESCKGRPIGHSSVTISGAYMVLPTLVTNQSELAQVIFSGAQIILQPLWTQVAQLEGITFIADWKAPEIRVKEMTDLGPEQSGAYRVSFEALIEGQTCSQQHLGAWTRTVSRSDLIQGPTLATPAGEPMFLTLSTTTTEYDRE